MPETMSLERRVLLLASARNRAHPGRRHEGAIAKANEILAKTPNAFPSAVRQSGQPASTTPPRPEIWTTPKARDILISGVARRHNHRRGQVHQGAQAGFKASRSSRRQPVLSAEAWTAQDSGDRAGFVPSVLDTGLVDEIIK